MKRRHTNLNMLARRERQKSRTVGYEQNAGSNRRAQRELIAEGRKEMRGRGKILEARNSVDVKGFLHPTKGYRVVGQKRAIAANLAAEIAAGNIRYDMPAIQVELSEALG